MAIRIGRRGAVLAAFSVALLASGCEALSGSPDAPTSAPRASRANGQKPAIGGVRVPRPAPAPSSHAAGSAGVPTASGGPAPSRRAGASGVEAPRYITGLRLTALRQTLEGSGLECSQTDASDLGDEWSCWATSDDGSVDYSVVIDAVDEHRVRHLTALVTQFGSPDPAIVAEFLGDLAAMPYRGARPAEARAWAAAWLAGEEGVPADVAIGHAALSLSGTLQSCSLDMAALERGG